MKRVLVALMTASLLALFGCNNQAAEPDAGPSTAQPSPQETPLEIKDVAGTYFLDDGSTEWTYHLTADGEYTLDVDGAKEITSGTFTLDGDTITFVEGESDGTTGTVDGETLVLDLGTLTKQ